MQAEYKLQYQKQNVADALALKTSSAIYNEFIEQKQSELEYKLSQLNAITANMPFTIKYMQGEQSSFQLSSTYTDQRRFMTVSFDFIAYSKSGILWYLLSTPGTLVLFYRLLILILLIKQKI